MATLVHAGMRVLFGDKLHRIKTRLNSVILKRHIETEVCSETSENTRESYNPRKEWKITCGKYAKLADGSAVAEYGGTAVMATVVGKGEPEILDIPLKVNYIQKSSAIGRIPSNFLRRDLGTSDSEILISRVIDRSLRSLFAPGYAIETQIFCQALALDGCNFPDIVAINAASSALSCSDIPWAGPVAAVRVGLIGKEVVINPTKLELVESSVNLIITSMKDENIVMIEGSCDNILLPDLQMCIQAGIKSSKNILNIIEDLQTDYLTEKRKITPVTISDELLERIESLTSEPLTSIFSNYELNKMSRDREIKVVFENCSGTLKEEFPDLSDSIINAAFFKCVKKLYRNIVKETDKRCDGRTKTDIRPIHCEVGLYEALHGSSVFQRGQTQVFCTMALDSPTAALRLDNITKLSSGLTQKNFFVHYTFPPYAVNEIGTVGGRNRREVGHGNLAENALKSAIPADFPFSMRLTSEVFESNGSSSMATVCGGTLALLDAGIPLNYEVAGVAIGLLADVELGTVKESNILTDIMGFEDYIGEMDFKIAGTRTGFTALQLDTKLPGLTKDIVFNALLQGKKAIGQILKKMNTVIKEPRLKAKENWPVIQDVRVPPALRSKFLGFGGSNIKKLEFEVGVELNETEPGKFSIFAVNQATMNEAQERIKQFLNSLVEPELEFGGVYPATVVEIKDTGCMVTLYPGMTPAFISLGQIDHRRVAHPSALGLHIGCEFQVKYFGRDPVTGHLRLSRKILMPKDSEI